MKTLLLTLTVLASLLLTLRVAQAIDPQAAEEPARSRSVGTSNTPAGVAPLSDGWNYVQPERFFTYSGDLSLYVRDDNGRTHIIFARAQQFNLAACAAQGRLLALYVAGGNITHAGCMIY